MGQAKSLHDLAAKANRDGEELDDERQLRMLQRELQGDRGDAARWGIDVRTAGPEVSRVSALGFGVSVGWLVGRSVGRWIDRSVGPSRAVDGVHSVFQTCHEVKHGLPRAVERMPCLWISCPRAAGCLRRDRPRSPGFEGPEAWGFSGGGRDASTPW